MKNARILYEAALGHYRKGRVDVAEPLYRAVLAVDPGHVEALCGLAVILKEKDCVDEAITLVELALKKDFSNKDCFVVLAFFLLTVARRQEARSALKKFQRYGGCKSDLKDVFERFGFFSSSVLEVWGEIDFDGDQENKELIELHSKEIKELVDEGDLAKAFDKAKALSKKYPDVSYFWKVAGTVVYRMGDLAGALPMMQKALAINSKDPELLNTLGNILLDIGSVEQSRSCLVKAIEISPDYAAAYNSLGVLQRTVGNFDEAIASYRKAIALRKNFSEAYSNIGVVFKEKRYLKIALRYYKIAVEKDANNVNAINNMAAVLQDLGLHDEALGCYDLAFKVRSHFPVAASNYLFVLNYHPDFSAKKIFNFYKGYDIRYGGVGRAFGNFHNNDRNPGRRLRLGYVSPDFR
ncbi:tetratricopeptide repeat protein, partial [Marichromatium bheemlicum]